MRITQIIDCSTTLHSKLVTWPGENAPQRTITSTLKEKGAELSQWTIGSHSGTHIDAPRHFTTIPTGVDELALDVLIGPAIVVDVTAIEGTLIEPRHIPKTALQYQRILFKTQNSVRKLLEQQEFVTDYVSFSEATAKLLVESNIQLVGVDYLSVERKGSPGHPVHMTLLTAGVINIEGIRLTDVEPGVYTLVALPTKLAESDGAPCRVVLLR